MCMVFFGENVILFLVFLRGIGLRDLSLTHHNDLRREANDYMGILFLGLREFLRNQDIRRYHSLAYAVVQKESDSLFSVLCLLRKVKK